MPRTLRVKTLIVGDAGVGKTSLAQTFCSDGVQTAKTYGMTLGLDITNRILQMPDGLGNVDFCIVDCSGHKDYEDLVQKMWDQPCAVIVVYDVTDRDSFTNAKKWANKVRTHLGEAAASLPAILVASKKDLESRRVISTEEGEELGKTLECAFAETSASDWESVLSPFHMLGQMLCRQYDQQVELVQSLSVQI